MGPQADHSAALRLSCLRSHELETGCLSPQGDSCVALCLFTWKQVSSYSTGVDGSSSEDAWVAVHTERLRHPWALPALKRGWSLPVPGENATEATLALGQSFLALVAANSAPEGNL